MQVVVRSGGKQYRVEEGAVVTVDRLAGDPGTTVTLEDVILLSDGDRLEAAPKARVTAEIVAHTKGEKIRVLHYKNKTRQRKQSGQRQLGTQLKITSIEESEGPA